MRRVARSVQFQTAAYHCLSKPIKQSELLAAIGALFWQVPAASTLPVDIANVTHADAYGKQAPSLAILLAEDNPISSRIALQVLHQAGHRVVAADSGTATLAAFEQGHFDLVLMDVQMPGMDGIETTKAIRTREQLTGRHVTIIALTAHALPQHRERCLLSGMDGYLVKPIQPLALLEAVAAIRCVPTEEIKASPLERQHAGRVLDQEALLERIGGDENVLQEVTGVFLDNGRCLMKTASNALYKHDASQFSYAIHTLAGMFCSLSADAASSRAQLLETASLIEAWPEMEEGFVLLEREVDLLAAALVDLSDEFQSQPNRLGTVQKLARCSIHPSALNARRAERVTQGVSSS